MRRTKTTQLVGVGVATTMALTACGGSTAGPTADGDPVAGDTITLTLWDQAIATPERNAALAEVFTGFQEANPDITLVREVYSADLETLTKNALRSQSTPDVVYAEVAVGRELYEAGLVANLADYAEQYGWNDRLTESGLGWTSAGDELFGLGLELEASGILYNKTLIEEHGLTIPASMAEMTDFCQAAQSADIIPYVTGASGGGWIYYFYLGLPIVNMLGPERERAFVGGESGAWTDPEIRDAVATVFETGKSAECFLPEMNALDVSAAYDMFVAGDAFAAVPRFSGDLTDVVAAMPDAELELLPWPAIEGGAGQYYQQGMGSAYLVNAKSENKDAAARLLDYMASEDVARVLIEKVGWIPPVELDVASLDVPEASRAIIEKLLYADMEMGISIDMMSTQQFNYYLGVEAQKVWEGNLGVDDYLTGLQQEWTAE